MILIFNAGSSSLKAKLFDQNLKEVKVFKIERIGSGEIKNHSEAAKIILAKLQRTDLCIIGHRVVHGGDKFVAPTEITDEVMVAIEKLSTLAPLHNPPALGVIQEVRKYCHPVLPSRLGSSRPVSTWSSQGGSARAEADGLAETDDTESIDKIDSRFRGNDKRVGNNIKIRQFAVFDTAFFQDLPKEAKYYPLPYEYFKKGIKKYGFHGISHEFAMEEANVILSGAKNPKKDSSPAVQNDKNVITIHLGAGCSIAALQDGRPIETSMGFTPNDGLMMMTRSGEIDPSIVLYMLKNMNLAPEKIEDILEKKSGLLGISGVSEDMRDILFVAGIKVEDPDYVMPANIKCDREHIKRSELAIEMFCRTIKKYIGGYMALLNNKVDALVFTGEIGYGSSILRERMAKDFSIKIISIEPNEELAIARMVSKIK